MRRPLICCVLWVCAAAQAGSEDDFSGVVTRIFDGDSFLVRPDGRAEVDVRLQDIDAPEKGQPHGDEARAALVKLIDRRRVFVDVVDVDRYERTVARVYREPDRLEIARALIHDGHVWVYRRTLREPEFADIEDDARSRRAGLWALPKAERMPPWRFRYVERKRRAIRTYSDRSLP